MFYILVYLNLGIDMYMFNNYIYVYKYRIYISIIDNVCQQYIGVYKLYCISYPCNIHEANSNYHTRLSSANDSVRLDIQSYTRDSIT